ncbi:unnamed protein product, partial [marine sediment metagenome]
FRLSFPADYPLKEISGKEILFKIKLKKISEKELPELNDEFAKRVGKVDSVEKLKEEVKKNLEAQRVEEAEAEVRDALIQQASESVTVDIPDALVKREADQMIDELSRSLKKSNVTLEQYLKNTGKDTEGLREELKPSASKRVKAKLVLRAMADKEKMEISEDELQTEMKALATGIERPEEEFIRSIDEAGRDYIMDYLLRRKALDFLVAEAKISKER